MWDRKYKDELDRKKTEAFLGGGQLRIDKQHSLGKMTARERLSFLFDQDTFEEIGAIREAKYCSDTAKAIPGDGVITGYGRINGNVVYASSQDFTVNGGSLGEAHSQKICRIMDMALDSMCPYISINDSGGARIEEGINSLSGYSGIFLRNTRASGVIPQIAVIMGPCAGGACYSPAICDFVFMVNGTSQMFITGPSVVKSVTGEQTSTEELGGANVHGSFSGVAHFAYENEKSCINGVRTLLSYLPANNTTIPKQIEHITVDDSCNIETIVPDNMRRAYDVRDVIYSLVDRDTFIEIHKDYAKNIVVGLCRIDGEVLGIVANQPLVMAGVLDVNASDKAARFVRFCDCFNIPILTLVDVPGYMPGTRQEHDGIIRHGAKLLYAYAEATVPKISLIMRKSYGGAYIAMNSKNLGADLVYAWPIAQLAVMGAEGAVDILYKKMLMESNNSNELRRNLIAEYEEHYLNPYLAAANGYIDDVIDSSETRKRISSGFASLKTKHKDGPWKKHGNIPL